MLVLLLGLNVRPSAYGIPLVTGLARYGPTSYLCN